MIVGIKLCIERVASSSVLVFNNKHCPPPPPVPVAAALSNHVWAKKRLSLNRGSLFIEIGT